MRVKLTESFHPKKTTLCILPATNSIGESRTVKAMRCTLAGIPIVSPEWIVACQGKVVVPASTMFIRSLPIKSTFPQAQSMTQFGVAAIAASRVRNKVLSQCTVHLCGEFSRPPKSDVEMLLREAGATTSQQVSSINAKLKQVGKASDTAKDSPTTTLVFLFDDNESDEKCGISGALERELKAALERTSASDASPPQVCVVGFQWLFDSVVAGTAMPATFYEPRCSAGKGLWSLQKKE